MARERLAAESETASILFKLPAVLKGAIAHDAKARGESSSEWLRRTATFALAGELREGGSRSARTAVRSVPPRPSGSGGEVSVPEAVNPDTPIVIRGPKSVKSVIAEIRHVKPPKAEKCDHPIGRRIGNGCPVCGETVK